MQVDYVDPLPEISPFLSTHIIKSKGEYALVDPGPLRAIDRLLRGLKVRGIPLEKIRYVLLTHIHIDHAGGVGKLLEYLPNAKVVMHKRGEKHMVNPAKLWESTKMVLGELAEFYGAIQPVPPDRIMAIDGDREIELGDTILEIYETPGHASHHIVFFSPETAAIFTGDAAGVYLEPYDVYFPTTPFPFRADKALKSLDFMVSLEPKDIFFPHYGRLTGWGTRYLEMYKELLVRWLDIIKEDPSLDIDELLIKLLQRDREFKETFEKIKGLDFWIGGLRRSIRGIREYVVWSEKNLGQSPTI